MSDQLIARLASGLAALAGLTVIISLAALFGLEPDRWFWTDFFAFLLALIIIVVAIGLALPSYLRWLHRPKLELELMDDTPLSRSLDGKIKGTISLSVRNLGSYPINSLSWHLFLPNRLNVQVTELSPSGEQRAVGNQTLGELVYVRGSVHNISILPSATFDIPIRVWCETADDRSEWFVSYALNTEYGAVPKSFYLHRHLDQAAAADCLKLVVRSKTL